MSVFILQMLVMMFAGSRVMKRSHVPAEARESRGKKYIGVIAAFLICLGCGVATGSLLFVSISMVMALCIHQEALVEESYCLDQYGEVYQKYMDQVSRWGS